ncbi:hypothetical protein PLESTB_001784800 [Pleodorina starrii]|uniref:Uncharacterized protein n=1 Tax=Pleodorina starrii TaxID=330485 RepID=A0A9W6C1C6_9CHLO|nr:hypothetical protein PLESTM_001755700 [Pleodorina starrii]GLC61630.1 hypothetical protein PLESTB_001784800 [Pleodorina starrii]GLC76545.1 hypothetical protein PLESTF_001794700 [Pleodorina starrii]
MSSPAARNPYVQWYQQNKTLVWGAAAAAVTVYATYKYAGSSTSSSDGDTGGPEGRARRQQSQFQRLKSMFKNYSEAASTLAETAALVSEDLRQFLSSDAAELPQSLRQLNKLLQAPELQETVSTVTASVVRGAMKATGGDRSPDAPPLVDTIIEAVLSERGRGLIGMAVGVAMRNSTTALCEFIERRMEAATAASGGAASLGVKDILDLLASDQGERLLTMLLTHSIRTAVTSYVDATSGYNLYNDMLASLVKQEHRDALTDLLSRISASFCREAVLSYRRGAAMASVGGGAVASSSSSSHAVNHAVSKHAAAVAVAANSTTSLQTGPVACSLSSGAAAAATAASPEAASASTEGCRTGALPAVKSNSQLAGSQNARPSATSQLHKQHSLGGMLGGVGNNALAMALGRGAMVTQTPPAWLRQVVELVKEREVRSLAVDVVKHASREASRGAVEGLLQRTGVGSDGAGSSSSSSSPCSGGVLVLPPSAAGYKLFVMASLAVSLCTYVLSPRVMLI